MVQALGLKIVNVLTWIFLLGSNSYGVSTEAHAGKHTYITPADFTNYVFVVTNLLLLGFIIYQFFEAAHEPVIEGVGWRFVIIGLLNAIFVHFEATGHHIVALVFIALTTASVSHVFFELRTIPVKGRADKYFVRLPFSAWHAYTIALFVLQLFSAFGKTKSADGKHHVVTQVFVCIALAFLASTSVGYAFHTEEGDIIGAAVIAWVLLGVFYNQRHPALIHWFALGAFVISLFSILKAVFTTARASRSDSGLLSGDGERAPLIGNEN
ncbi:uncharacterized protein L969DRAFT_84289 [Mixia osmundae IAM 14324]|uniref:uncharacterized protein n=1 Tax=Mixia osmundae (strain CBS 9802 / IAM 14324 / JCM 22182 / KY 12970) TaxID=764103 RepID=UPI0004A55065|nr:uncharacterized protein L969DRAFT_84289 [Mixia osmundae IAM 14324]KEI42432.1 hypothetical protein L969DRAFT_84289 [Mixia osmundae IAM 14324]